MIRAFLNKPYPRVDSFKANVISSFLIGFFVAAFLIFFQPFEISLWQTDHKNLKLAGFGLVSFVIPIVSKVLVELLPVENKDDHWTVWKEILNITLSVLLIAAGNLLYASLINIGHITLSVYLDFILITFSIGIFPICISVVAKHNRYISLNQQTAREINTHLEEVLTPAHSTQEKLVLLAENGKDKFELPVGQLLYMTAADNYTEVFFLAENKLRKELIRGSLKRMELQCASFPEILRCHRAYLVNTQRVKHIEGNAAGYKLSLENCENEIPVSRNYGTTLTEKLRKTTR